MGTENTTNNTNKSNGEENQNAEFIRQIVNSGDGPGRSSGNRSGREG